MPMDREALALDYVRDLTFCQSIEAIRSHLAHFILHFELRYFIISGIPGPYDGLVDKIVCHNLPAAWVDLYVARNFIVHDPIVRECLTSSNAFCWSDIKPKYARDTQATEVMRQAEAHGLKCGVCLPIHGLNGYEGGVSLSGDTDVQWSKTDIAALHLVSLYTFQQLKVTAHSTIHNGNELTRREKQVLLWSALGKTAHETAEILGVSEETVNSHIKHCLVKLECSNKVEAVAMAMRGGYINR